MSGLRGKKAMVTGASRGIGRAIALALARQRADVTVTGRSQSELAALVQEIVAAGGNASIGLLDVADLTSVSRFADHFSGSGNRLDILVNCAGIYSRSCWLESSVASLETLLDSNVRGVFAITKALLPRLIESRGDIVFINSSIVDFDGKDVGVYAATQRARSALADSLRAEVNERGVRVMSIYPGRTATSMQERIYAADGRDYDPARLLQPEDIAETVIACLQLAATAEVTEIRIRPRNKS